MVWCVNLTGTRAVALELIAQLQIAYNTLMILTSNLHWAGAESGPSSPTTRLFYSTEKYYLNRT